LGEAGDCIRGSKGTQLPEMVQDPPIPPIEIRPLRDDEADEACALAAAVFDECVAPLYGDEGRRGFLTFAQPAALLRRRTDGYVTWVAAEGPRLVGMLHVRDSSHLSMLFVERARQGAGIARQLFETALARFVLVGPLTVNSSPNAVGFYARVGFRATGPEQIKNGIRFVPMRRDFPDATPAARPAGA